MKSKFKLFNKVTIAFNVYVINGKIEKNRDVIDAVIFFTWRWDCQFYYTGNKRRTYWCEFEGYYKFHVGG